MSRVLFSFLLGFVVVCLPAKLFSQLAQNDVFINEFYPNPAQNQGKEYVELVVKKNHADLRGIRLSDDSAKGITGSSSEGSLILPNASYLADVPQWTIIVCVLQTPVVNLNLFTQDVDISDGKLVLFSKALPNGVLDTTGRMDISLNENLEVLSNSTPTAVTIDYIAMGTNTSYPAFSDASWNSNLTASVAASVTYFTNSAGGGLINDNSTVGWFTNGVFGSRSPGSANPGQVLPIANFPPVIVDVSRSPFIPLNNTNDTILCHATDEAGVSRVVVHYISNDVLEDSALMARISGTALDGYYRGIIPASVNADNAKISFYVTVKDNNTTNPYTTQGSEVGYFAGITSMSLFGVKNLNNDNQPRYSGYAVRVKGGTTVSSGVFSSNILDSYIQDDSGGINIYDADGLLTVNEGRGYLVTGTVGFNNGRTQLTPPQFSVNQISPATEIIPQLITIGQYLENPEQYEGSLIRFQQCTKTGGTWPGPGTDAEIQITDGTGAITLFINGNTNVGDYPEQSYPLNFTGVGFQNDASLPFTDNNGVLLRSIADISVGPVNQPPVLTNLMRTTSVPLAGQRDTVYVTITDDGDVSYANVVYTVNDTKIDSAVMYEFSKKKMGGKKVIIYIGFIPAAVNQNGNRVSYYAHVADDGTPALGGVSEVQKYFAGFTPLAFTKAKKINENGELAYDGYAIRVVGKMTVGDSVFSSSRIDDYLQDDSGGINIFHDNFLQQPLYQNGAYVITGTLTSLNGMTRIADPYFSAETSSFDHTIEPKTLLLAELNANPERYEGMLILVQQCNYIDGTWPETPSDAEILFQTPEQLYGTFFLSANGDFSQQGAPGWPVDAMGVLRQFDATPPFDEGYKLAPRRSSDLVTVEPNNPPDAFDLIFPDDNTQYIYNYGNLVHPFSWNRSRDPEHSPVKYRIVFSADNSFTNILGTFISGRGGSDSLVNLTGVQAATLIRLANAKNEKEGRFTGNASKKNANLYWRVIASDGVYNTISTETFKVELGVNNVPPTSFTLISPTAGASLILTDTANAPPIDFIWNQANDLDESDIINYYMAFCETKSFSDSTLYIPRSEDTDSVITVNTISIDPAALYNKYLAGGRDSVIVYWVVKAMDSFWQEHTTGSSDTIPLLLMKTPVGFVEQNGVIINEFLPNPAAADGKEYIELLVTKPGVSDLRGFRLSDVSEKGAPGTGFEGHLDFPNAAYLARVPQYTRIVCVLASPPGNPNVYTQDLDPSDSVLVLFSEALPGGVLDTVGLMDLEVNENIALLRGASIDAATIDYVATGNNASQSSFPDAVWVTNLNQSAGGTVTYFTNSKNFGLINDDKASGWKENQPANKKSPGKVNPTQIAGVLGDTPPTFLLNIRSPFIPNDNGIDTIFSAISDNMAIDTAWIYYSVNERPIDSMAMRRFTPDSTVEVWGAVFPSQINNPRSRVSYFVKAKDNNGLINTSTVIGYFVGTQLLSYSTIRAIDTGGVAKYAGWGVRVHGIATTTEHTFSPGQFDAYIQDDSGGINLFKFLGVGEDTVHVKIGFPYTAEGTLTQFRGKIELSTPNFKINGDITPQPVTPRNITIAQWVQNPDYYEGRFIQFSNVRKVSGNWPSADSNAAIQISDSTGVATLFINKNTDVDNSTEPQYPIVLAGISSQFDGAVPPYHSGYEIIPRNRIDIISVGAPTGFDLVGPANDTTLEYRLGARNELFAWDNATDPNGDSLKYKVIFSRDNLFAEIIDTIQSDQNGRQASLRLTGKRAALLVQKAGEISNFTFFWKVIVSDGGNITSSNQVRSVSISIVNEASTEFHLISPGNNTRIFLSSNPNSPLKLHWGISVDADSADTAKYYIVFCENKGFKDSTFFSPNIVGSSVTLVNDTAFTIQQSVLRQRYLAARDSAPVYWTVRAQDGFGIAHEVGSMDTFKIVFKRALGVEEDNLPIPKEYYLTQNFPNPFNPATEIRFGLPHDGFVTITIYDITGKNITTLVSGHFNAGNYTTQWDASTFASGIYFYRIQAGEYVRTKKLMLMK